MIKAKVLCDSVNENGNRLTTFEVEFPRFILSEYNTHRQFSRNAASTRAIPILKQLELIESSPAMPTYYGKNQSGMSASEELDELPKQKCISIIDEMRLFCISKVKELHELGLHKQHAGRYVEAWQTVKGVVSSTEWANWYWLRDHEAAQPEIAELARKMKEAYDNSTPQLLKDGECHLPYVYRDIEMCLQDDGFGCITRSTYYLDESMTEELSTQDAIKVSAARCAAISYRKEDYSLEKCLQLYERLVGDERKHSSALEHQATPMKECIEDYSHGYDPHYLTNISDYPLSWEEGISHSDSDGNLWSGNLKGWIQHRKTIDGECYKGENNV
jgi:thymidylate synthase ThyX